MRSREQLAYDYLKQRGWRNPTLHAWTKRGIGSLVFDNGVWSTENAAGEDCGSFDDVVDAVRAIEGSPRK